MKERKRMKKCKKEERKLKKVRKTKQKTDDQNSIQIDIGQQKGKLKFGRVRYIKERENIEKGKTSRKIFKFKGE